MAHKQRSVESAPVSATSIDLVDASRHFVPALEGGDCLFWFAELFALVTSSQTLKSKMLDVYTE